MDSGQTCQGQDNEGQSDAHLAVNMRVRVYPGTDAESRGVIVEDFGELAGQAVDIGGTTLPTRPDGGRFSWTPALWCSSTPTTSFPTEPLGGSTGAVNP